MKLCQLQRRRGLQTWRGRPPWRRGRWRSQQPASTQTARLKKRLKFTVDDEPQPIRSTSQTLTLTDDLLAMFDQQLLDDGSKLLDGFHCLERRQKKKKKKHA